MNLLVAAHRALLRSLSTCLWDPPAEENCGRASRRLRQNSTADTSSHHHAVCPIRRRQASVCGRFRASAWRHRAAYPHALTNQVPRLASTSLARTGSAVRALDLTYHYYCGLQSAALSTTFILYWPIRSHRALGWRKPFPMHVCVSTCW